MIHSVTIYTVTIREALFAFWSPGPAEMMVLAAVALLLYGGKLPEVARSWGKSLAEFRRGLSGIQNEINDAIYSTPDRLKYHPEENSSPNDSAEEYGGYEEALENGTPSDDTATESTSADDTSTDPDSADAAPAEEQLAEKRAATESD